MAKKKGLDTVIILTIIFVLAILCLLGLQIITLRPEFYASFAGAAAALIFSALVTYYFAQKTNKQNQDTKAQIIQTLLIEIQLNLNNIANFIKSCREGRHFQFYATATMQKNFFWPKFLLDYPHPSFELTQQFDMLYSTFFLMDYYSREVQFSLPEPLRNDTPLSPPLPLEAQEIIRRTALPFFDKWKFNVKAMVEYYDKLREELSKDYAKYSFKNQTYYEQNESYEMLRRFYLNI